MRRVEGVARLLTLRGCESKVVRLFLVIAFQRLEELKFAVIGAGRIGTAIIRSLVACGATQVVGTGRREETLENVRKLGVKATRDNRWAASWADVVIISVKPHHLAGVVKEIMSVVRGKVLVSVVAGVRVKTLEKLFSGAIVYRAMPNINAVIGKSSTAITPARENKYDVIVDSMFKCMGSVYWIPEELFDVWTALIGSGPAFVAEIVDALVLGAVSAGMPRDIAYRALLDMIASTVELLRDKMHPSQLRDLVATPAGTTIKGLKVLEERAVKAALMEVVEKSVERSRELGEEIDRIVSALLANSSSD